MVLDPHIAVLLAGIIGGTSGLFVKAVSVPSTTFTFFRCLIPSLFVIGILTFRKKHFLKKTNKAVIWGSILNAGRMYLFFLAFTYTSVTNGVIILYTWPLYASAFAHFFYGEKLTRIQIGLLLLSFLGLVIMYSGKPLSFHDRDFAGMVIMTISAIMYALSIVVFKKERKRLSSLETVFFQNIAGAILFLPFALHDRLSLDPLTITITLSYAVIFGIVLFWLFFYALHHLRTSTTSTIAYIEVLVAIALSVVLLHETLTLQIMGGGMLILLSTGLIQRQNK